MNKGSQEVLEVMNIVYESSKQGLESGNHTAASTQEQLATMEEIESSAKSLSDLAEELQKGLNKFKV
ncbi:Methyl-accepting chemotaxis protein McpA [compost metagenome]